MRLIHKQKYIKEKNMVLISFDMILHQSFPWMAQVKKKTKTREAGYAKESIVCGYF